MQIPTMERKNMNDEHYIGKQIDLYRKVRGMTQEVLAGRLGISQAAVSYYVNGERGFNRAILLEFAEALKVSVSDLTGHQDDKLNPSLAAFMSTVPRIETAIMTAGEMDLHRNPAPLAELVAQADAALDVRMACDYAGLGAMLPPLITDLYRWLDIGDGEQQRQAGGALTGALVAAGLAVKSFGYTSLAWNCAQAAAAAAEVGGRHDQAGVLAAQYLRSQVLLATPGALNAALGNAEMAVETAGSLNDGAAISMLGMSHLQKALTEVTLSKDPADSLSEAAELATVSGRTDAFSLEFGPSNVNVWRMSIAIEQREPGRVLQIADSFDPKSILTADRLARYHIEKGRAYTLDGEYEDALASFLTAEHVAPEHVRHLKIVSEDVGRIVRKARRGLVNGELGQLARRVGAVA